MANKIAIEIVVDDKGTVTIKQFGAEAQKALGGTSAAAQKSDGAFTGMVGTLKNMIGIAAAAFGVHQITSYAKEAVALAARVETLGVVLGVVGENAGYSRGEMARYVEEVKRMGITTEVAHDAVIKIAQAQIDVADSAKLARVAQDAAVIGNINSSEAFQRMINGIRSGEVEILKTIGLNVQFEQGYQRMAQQLGKNADSLTNQEKAQARANLVMEAGARIAGAYEASMGTAGKMMSSLSRLTDELQLGFGQLFSGALTDAVFGITGYLKDMNKYMEQMRDSGALSDVTDMVTTGLKTAWISVKDVIIAVWNALRPLGPMISDMLPLLDLARTGWGYIFAALKPIGTVIGEIIASVFNLGKVVGSAFGALGAALAGDFGTAKAYATQLDQTWAALGKSATNAYAAVTDGVAQAVIAYEVDADAAVTATRQKTKAEKAAEEAVSKARAESAKSAIAAERDRMRVAADAAKESKRLAEAVAKAKAQAEKEITEAIRKNTFEIDAIGLSQHEKDIMRINQEVEKFRAAGVDKAQIAQFVAGEMEIANRKAYEEMAKAARKAEGEAIDAMEKQIAEGMKLTEAHLAGARQYETMVSEAADFAATENERAINKIIAGEKGKLAEVQLLYDLGKISFEQAEWMKKQIHKQTAAAMLAQEAQNLKNQADFYDQIAGYAGETYALKVAWIDLEAVRLAKLYGDDVAAAEWAKQRKDKLMADDLQARAGYYGSIDGYAQQSYIHKMAWIDAEAVRLSLLYNNSAAAAAWAAQEHIKAYVEMGKKSEDFKIGVLAGILEMQQAQKTWGTVGYDIVRSFAADATKQLDENLFLILKGKWSEIEFDFGSILDNMLRILTAKIAEMIVQWGIYQAAVYAASAFGFQAPGGITNPFAAATTNPLGTAGAAYSAYAALAGGTTAAGAAGFTAAELGLAASGASFTGGVAATGTTAAAGMGALGTLGLAAGVVAGPLLVGYAIESLFGGGEYKSNANMYATPQEMAEMATFNIIQDHNFQAQLGGENWEPLAPSLIRDAWKMYYDLWYSDMARYFGQIVPQTISANEAWLKTSYYLGGGYPAKSGLDYVPYDDFHIRAHRGEAVLPEREAEEWRTGGRGGVVINGPLIQIDGNLIAGEKEFNAFVKKIGQRLDRFAARRIDARVS